MIIDLSDVRIPTGFEEELARERLQRLEANTKAARCTCITGLCRHPWSRQREYIAQAHTTTVVGRKQRIFHQEDADLPRTSVVGVLDNLG